jgi:uncharacterized repeat protein (TIGR01451 family)
MALGERRAPRSKRHRRSRLVFTWEGVEDRVLLAQSADVAIAISASPKPVLVGQALTYVVTVTNHGPDTATNVIVTDSCPASMTLKSAVDSQGTRPQIGAGIVVANLGTLGASQSATLTIIAVPKQPAPQGVTDTASVVADQLDTQPFNNTAQITVAVNPVIDLPVSLTATPDPVAVDGALTYTITVSNSTLSTASNVVITDTLPANVVFVSASASQGGTPTASGSTVTAAIGQLAPRSSATVTIVVTPTADAVPSVTDSVIVTSDETDPGATDSSAQVTTTVSPVADLIITAAGSPNPVLVGGSLTYTLTVTNNGPNDATGVTVVDAVPTTTTYTSSSSSQGAAPAFAGGNVTALLGTIPSGGTATVTIMVTPTVAATDGNSTVSDTATVSENEIDPAPGNNSATTTTTVMPVADLNLVMSGNLDPVRAGQQLIYTLVVLNNGPNRANSVQIIDFLPDNVTFDSSDAPGGTTVSPDGTVVALLNPIAPNSLESLTLVVTPNAAAALGDGTIMNRAIVSGAEADPDTDDNAATLTTTVLPSSHLAVSIKGPGSAAVDQPLTYVVTLTNVGPSEADHVILTDQLPAGVTYDTAGASQGTTTESDGLVTVNVGTLASNATLTLTIVATPAVVGTIQDQAAVTSTTYNPESADERTEASTTIYPVADVSVTVSASPNPVVVGKSLTYTVTVSNAGPSDATGVVVTETLPGNVSFGSMKAPAAQALSQVKGVVKATFLVLHPGASATLTVLVTPNAAGSLLDKVSAYAPEADSRLSNNAAQVTTTALPPPGVLQFTATTYTVLNTAGSMKITVSRTAGTRGAVSVHYATAGGTAKPGQDYNPVSGTLIFKDGVASQSFTIPIHDYPYNKSDVSLKLLLTSPTGGATLGQSATASLTIKDLTPDIVPPTVTQLTLNGAGTSISGIVVWFSKEVNPAVATNVNNYHIYDAGASTYYTPGQSPLVLLKSAVYNPAQHSVTLVPWAPLPGGESYFIDVRGSGIGSLADSANNHLAGNGSGQGTDFCGYFARGTTVRYSDADHHSVQLQVMRGGVINLTRYANGEGNTINLSGIVPHQTTLTGSVRGGTTSFNTITGLGQFGAVRISMATPPFYVKNYPFASAARPAVLQAVSPVRFGAFRRLRG